MPISTTKIISPPEGYEAFSYRNFINNTTRSGLYRGEIIIKLGNKLLQYNTFLANKENLTNTYMHLNLLAITQELCELFMASSGNFLCLFSIPRSKGQRFSVVEQLRADVIFKSKEILNSIHNLSAPDNITNVLAIPATMPDNLPADHNLEISISDNVELSPIEDRPNQNFVSLANISGGTNPQSPFSDSGSGIVMLEHGENIKLSIIKSTLNLIVGNFIICNSNGEIVFANNKFIKLYGSEKNIVGSHIDSLMPKSFQGRHEYFFAGYSKATNAGVTFDAAKMGDRFYDLVTQRGIIPCEITLSPLQAKNGDFKIIAHFKDRRPAIAAFNKESLLQKELFLANIDKQELDRFICRLLHDIRGPLTGVKGCIELSIDNLRLINTHLQKIISTDPNINPEINTALSDISSLLTNAAISCHHAIEVSSEWLVTRFDTSSSLKFSPINITALCNDIASIARANVINKPIAIKIIVENHLSDLNILGDNIKLKEILLNLILNSIKYTDSGRVQLQITEVQRQGEDVNINFIISDTGPGISDAQILQIFSDDELVTRNSTANNKHDGTGLGLKIVRSLISFLGGKLKVENNLEVGSKFIVNITFKMQTPSLLETPNETPSLLHLYKTCLPNNPKVLIVDDVEINRSILKIMLNTIFTQAQAAPIDFIFAADGCAAIEQYQLHEPALIFMDINMPKMDGIAATRLIREHEADKSLPPAAIIAISALETESIRKQCCEAGFHHANIGKPFDKEKLKDVISMFMGEGSRTHSRYTATV